MKSALTLLLFAFFFSLLTQNLEAQEGLFKAKDTRVPGAIEIAGESVLQIVLTGEPAQKIPAASYDAYLATPPRENFVLYLTLQKIKKCKESGLAFCEIKYKSYGSGFLTDDGQTLWSARHVLEPQLKGKLSFELFNSDGEILFDTSDSKDQVSIALVGDKDLIQKRHANKYILDDSFKQLGSDYIKLRLNHSLAIRALKLSTQKPQINQRVFTVGYANISGYRAVANTGEIKNRSRVAIGTLSPYTEQNRVESPAQKESRMHYENVASEHLLIMHMDGLPGQSGSPVLNEAGEVVGIFVAGNSTVAGRGALRGIAPHFDGIFKNGH